jgi:uncharacterized membrane protein YbhN (UPF0104 family)
MSRSVWTGVRLLGGVAILAVLVWRVGTGPFLKAAGMIDGPSLAATAVIAVLTTGCCAWRWSLVARALGVGVPLRTAVAAYYRSQFLNTVLPGGVLGDVHRGIRHGREVGAAGRGIRAVAWERSAGQLVQLMVAVAVLLVLPSPVSAYVPALATGTVAAALGLVLVGRRLSRGRSLRARALRVAAADLRGGLLTRRTLLGTALASAVVAVGHAATFLIAARSAGASASTARMLPLALLVLLAMGMPTNVAGWGPREGVAAWAFAVAGLGAAQGVATAVVYGAMVLVASLPGAGVLVAEWLKAATRGPSGAGTARPAGPPAAALEGAACG